MDKSSIFLSLDQDSLKELRKVLFRRGLSPHEFFSYILERVAMRDTRTEQFISEILENKQRNIMGEEGGSDEENKISAEALYQAIERNLNSKTE